MTKKPKVLLPMITVVIMVSVIILSVATTQFSAFVATRVAASTERAALKFISNLEGEKYSAQVSAMFLAGSTRIIEALESQDREALAERIQDIDRSLEFDVYIFTDETGHVILSLEDRFPQGMDVSRHPAIHAALQGESVSSLERGPSHNLQVTAGRGVTNPEGEIIGAVFIGTHVGQKELLEEMRTISGSDFTLFVDDACVISSIGGTDGSSCEAIDRTFSFETKNDIVRDTFQVKGEDFLGLLLPLENNSGHVLGTMLIGQFMADTQSAIDGFLMTGLVVTAVILGVSIMVIIIRAKAVDASITSRDLLLQETNQRLELALEDALSASRAKGEFLSVMSHEMRTPLNVINGLTQIALKERGETANAALRKVATASEHLLGMINNVLEVAKIEADKLELVESSFVLGDMISKVEALLSGQMTEKNHGFIIEIDPNLPHTAIGDEQRLTQILINLLSNAATYTPDGGKVKLHAALCGKTSNRFGIRFSVTDTGVGIPASQHERLFERFEQLDCGSNRKYGGAGLGLAISQSLLQLMGGGSFNVDSEPGKGSKFSFDLILSYCPQAEKNKELTVCEVETTADSKDVDLSTKKILLAEDMEINQEILIALLEETGIQIETAANGEEAFHKIQQEPEAFDLVLMDIQMPIMCGIESTRHIRKFLNRDRKLPIIALTANVFAEDIEIYLRAGMDDHIGKPIRLDHLLETLRKHLK